MAKQNKTKYAVLGVISRKPSSGYDIKKVFEQYMSEFWSESYGQIYPMVKSLVEQGCSTYTVERTEGKPDRHVFSITDKGIEELREWLELPTEPHKERLEVLLKLLCGAYIPTETSIKLIKRFREEWTNHLKRYEEILDSVNTEFKDSPHLPYMRMSVSCGMHIGNAYVAWCDETITTLRAMEPDPPNDQSEQ